MYWHAWRIREVLGLSAYESAYTLTLMVRQLMNGAIALLSMVVASLLKPEHAGLAGYVYLLVPAVLNVQGMLWRRRRRELEPSPHPL